MWSDLVRGEIRKKVLGWSVDYYQLNKLLAVSFKKVWPLTKCKFAVKVASAIGLRAAFFIESYYFGCNIFVFLLSNHPHFPLDISHSVTPFQKVAFGKRWCIVHSMRHFIALTRPYTDWIMAFNLIRSLLFTFGNVKK